MKPISIPTDRINHMSRIYKILSDETRLHILWHLLDHELCVSDLANRLNMSNSSISHQLRELRMNQLVIARKDGKKVFYRLMNSEIRERLLQEYDYYLHQ